MTESNPIKRTRIHFIREVLVCDRRGPLVPTMEVSYDRVRENAEPRFQHVLPGDEASIRALYIQLGGVRKEGDWVGSTVVIRGLPFWSLGSQVLSRFEFLRKRNAGKA